MIETPRMRLNTVLNGQDVPPYGRSISSVESSPGPRTPHVRSPPRSVDSPTRDGVVRKARINGSSVSSLHGFMVEPGQWTSPRFTSSVNSPPGQACDKLVGKPYSDYKDLHSSESSFSIDCRSRNPPSSTHRLNRVTHRDCNVLNTSADFTDSVELSSPPLSARTPTFLLNPAPLCSPPSTRRTRCPPSQQQKRPGFPFRLSYSPIHYRRPRAVSEMATETPGKLPGIHEICKFTFPGITCELDKYTLFGSCRLTFGQSRRCS